MCLRISPALAQQSTPDAYERALERSLAAHAEGALDVAQAAMEEAHALSPNARTWRGLGVIAYERGAYLAAIAPLETALRTTQKPLTSELERGVRELLARIWQRVARLSLHLEPAYSQVNVDGAAPVFHTPSEIVLLPGRHDIGVSAFGRRPYALRLNLTEPRASPRCVRVPAARPAAWVLAGVVLLWTLRMRRSARS